MGAPLTVGYGKGENYLGSDALALAPLTQQIAYLEEGKSQKRPVLVWCAAAVLGLVLAAVVLRLDDGGVVRTGVSWVSETLADVMRTVRLWVKQ